MASRAYSWAVVLCLALILCVAGVSALERTPPGPDQSESGYIKVRAQENKLMLSWVVVTKFAPYNEFHIVKSGSCVY
eukprot:1187429-Prorocentrum_minimum.AAC.6